jgi:hypothetical protein
VSVFHVAWRTAGAATWHMLQTGLPGVPPCAVSSPARLALVSQAGAGQDELARAASPESALLALGPAAIAATFVDPAANLLAVAAAAGTTLHYWRLADASLKPLPAGPVSLQALPGDTYVAVVQAGMAPDGPALARFIHLRDSFNADKLAANLLEHMAELGDTTGQPAGVLVVEAR